MKTKAKFKPVVKCTHKKFVFEDLGQDLLWIMVELKTGVITDCGPWVMNKSIFLGLHVFLPRFIKKGDLVEYSETPITKLNQPLKQFKYKVTQIEIK